MWVLVLAFVCVHMAFTQVKDEDNIKQDMSIDVYGRKDAAKEVGQTAQ